jgi:hypothetical protein
MRPLLVLAGTVLALTTVTGVATPAAAAARGHAPAGGQALAGVEVTVDQSRVGTVIGDTFTIHTRVSNTGASATDPLLAHLNVVSLTSDVYVDPEDWSSSRTQELTSLAPGASTQLSWEIQAVNAGSFDVYVVVLPDGTASAGSGPLVVSPPVHAEVAARRTLNAEGSLPIVVAVPVLLGLVTATIRLRLRRAR